MIRLASIGGMTGGFLMISPGLRGNVIKGYSMVVDILNDASPWSYLGIGILMFVLLTMELYRHAIPKHKKVRY
ncbi:MAG: hypothetical protein P4L56_15265 [Candidatus Sulfopaludibacter sp.]|nr:hypothetical protein [Candidatus Sulfopaludibacter sp.]